MKAITINSKSERKALYGKGLIHLRLIFRLTNLAFLRAGATLKKNTILAPKI